MLSNEVVWYRLGRQKMTLATEVRASRPSRRAWVCVTPMRRKPWGACTPAIREYFLLLYFELERDAVAIVRDSYDYDEYLLHRAVVRVLAGEERDPALQRLARVLSRWRADPRALVQPWAGDYPL